MLRPKSSYLTLVAAGASVPLLLGYGDCRPVHGDPQCQCPDPTAPTPEQDAGTPGPPLPPPQCSEPPPNFGACTTDADCCTGAGAICQMGACVADPFNPAPTCAPGMPCPDNVACITDPVGGPSLCLPGSPAGAACDTREPATCASATCNPIGTAGTCGDSLR